MIKDRVLVSVLLPCYNVEKKIARMMESLLNQTYCNLELIFVDDGSTDGTKDIILQYKPEYEKKGYIVHYIYQDNKGVAGAVNTGLKYITGAYLTWPDPDDWLEKDSIEKKLSFLQLHPEYAAVTSNAWIHMADEIHKTVKRMDDPVPKYFYRPNQFKLLLRYKSVFCPGCHMVRMSDFDFANPKRDIYESRRGQNFQMLLPVYYTGKRYFMNESLCHYVIYSDSLSHSDNTKEKQIANQNGLTQILQETLNRIEMPRLKKQWYMLIVLYDDKKRRLDIIMRWKIRTWLGESTWEKLRTMKNKLKNGKS